MAKRLSARRRGALLRDIFNAEHDVVALAEAHGLTPDALAAWAADAGNRQCLAGLCVLADVQTQLLLSRYRLLAATRLIRLATEEAEGVKPDDVRRACVDLLRLDLKRAGGAGGGTEDDEPRESGPVDRDGLRELLFAEVKR